MRKYLLLVGLIMVIALIPFATIIPASSVNADESDAGLYWTDLGQLSTKQIRSMTYLENGTALFSDANPGHVFRSTNYGLNWTDLGAVDEGESLEYLGNGIVLMGAWSDVYRSADYGLTWTSLEDGSGNGLEWPGIVYAIQSLGNGKVILGDSGGSVGHVFRSTNYGLNWTDLGQIDPEEIWAMTYFGDGIVTLGTGIWEDGNVYRSTNYGLNWTGPTTVATDAILSMKYLGCAGEAILSSYDYGIYRTLDYGVTWTPINLNMTEIVYINCIATNGNGIIIMGDSGGHVWRSTNYGANGTWTDLGQIATGYINSVAYLEYGVFILGDIYGHVFRSTPTGDGWLPPWPGPDYVPYNLLAIPISSTEIALTWNLGVNTTGSRIMGKTGGWTSAYDDSNATLVYEGSGTSATNEGLTPGTTYYYRAWGELNGTYSEDYAEDLATTFMGAGGGDEATAPMPPWWFQNPSCAAYNQTPVFGLMTTLFASYDLPECTGCLLVTIFLLILIGILVYSLTHNALTSGLILAVAIVVMSIAGLLPMWMLLVVLIMVIGITFAWSRA